MKQTVLALIGLLILNTGKLAYAESYNENMGGGVESDLSYTSISKSHYYVGSAVPLAVPVVSTFLGMTIPTFGIGHAIQGRYMSRGWIFTVGELVTTGAMIYFLISAENSIFSGDITGMFNSGSGLLVSILAHLGFIIWEAVDVWLLPSHIKVSNSPFELSPTLMATGSEKSFGLSLKYKF